jgi:hypothetical protein
MTLNIPPIDIIAFLQANILEALIMVVLATAVGFNQKSWVNRIVYFVVSLYPAFYLAEIGIELFLTSNWRFALAGIFIAIGTWVLSKGK